jgi:hypothetical protein
LLNIHETAAEDKTTLKGECEFEFKRFTRTSVILRKDAHMVKAVKVGSFILLSVLLAAAFASGWWGRVKALFK